MPTRREAILQIVFGWVAAAVFLWIDLLLLVANTITMRHYAHALGSKPLPLVTVIVTAPASPFYWFPAPLIIFAALMTFSGKYSSKERFSILGICLMIALAASAAIVFGTVIPAIPYWLEPLQS